MPFGKKNILPKPQPNEQVQFIIRKHWVVLASRLLFWILYAALILFVGGLTKSMFPVLAGGDISSVISLVETVLMMHASLAIFLSWALYYLNVQIVTNERIVDIDQHGLLRHETSELHMHKIEDVTTEIVGPMANFFNYGNIYVQTAGERNKFTFESVANPHGVARAILELYERATQQPGRPASSDQNAQQANHTVQPPHA